MVPSLPFPLFLLQEYDYVFDIDVEEGSPPLKLPYNNNQDPWMVAQQFLWKHSLPQTYLDEVARFIQKGAPNAGRGAETAGSAVDPFTGRGWLLFGYRLYSDRKSQPKSWRLFLFGTLVPFTGGSRYVPGRGGRRAVEEVVFSDPLTGGTRCPHVKWKLAWRR
ncbi:MAG: hypothetical protein GY696_19670 [Gammaproteobacteria bacterium]|nr:hypothetical protein [Gammaproteobacteria bacterium]